MKLLAKVFREESKNTPSMRGMQVSWINTSINLSNSFDYMNLIFL